MIFHGRGGHGGATGAGGVDKATTAPVTIIIRQKCKHACHSRAEQRRAERGGEGKSEQNPREEIQRFLGNEGEREREPPQIKDVSDRRALSRRASERATGIDGELMVK